MDDMDVYMLICLFEKAFPGITCGECREAIDRLKDADIKVKIVPKGLLMHKPYNMNKNLEECPLDTFVILTDEYNNMYIGTVTKKKNGQLTRGECIDGNAELFYRNKIVGWKSYYPM